MSKKPVISRFSPWIRLYTSIRNDPKIIALPYALRWHYISLLTCAAESPDGVLPSDAHIAIELRLSPGDTKQVIDDLILCGLLDIVLRGESRRLRPHNWTGRQYKSDSSTERSRRHRQRSDATACNVAATLHDRCSNVPALYSASNSAEQRILSPALSAPGSDPVTRKTDGTEATDGRTVEGRGEGGASRPGGTVSSLTGPLNGGSSGRVAGRRSSAVGRSGVKPDGRTDGGAA